LAKKISHEQQHQRPLEGRAAAQVKGVRTATDNGHDHVDRRWRQGLDAGAGPCAQGPVRGRGHRRRGSAGALALLPRPALRTRPPCTAYKVTRPPASLLFPSSSHPRSLINSSRFVYRLHSFRISTSPAALHSL